MEKQKINLPISKEDIQQLVPIQFSGQIRLIRTEAELNNALEDLSRQEMVGLDTEKRPTFRKGQYHPVSLLQLATLDTVYLIQLQKTGFPSSLKNFLANSQVKKIGIALHDDIKDLQKLGSFQPAGFLQLNQMAHEKGVPQTGARSLTAKFLGRRLSKSSQKSDWGRLNLTEKQMIYAATDAWICLMIYPLLVAYDP